ncbi:MAG TPA: thiamine pyrophosphate-dependent enzyme [Burkholderiales bacterium]|nr:thiamine pyrophosphate-dependent enzyme [Burkholderiales bacterium]
MALERYDLLQRLASRLPQDALVMSTYIGAVSFEWAAITDEHPRTAQLGQMGNVIGLAVGLAAALPHRKIVCLDGDGSVLMELGQLVVLGQESPENLAVFVVDNGVYESIGWGPAGPRPSATSHRADLAALARGAGVPHAVNVATAEELEGEMELAFSRPGCRFINVRTAPGHARVPPRQSDAFEAKYRFVRHVERLEGRQILQLARQDRQLMRRSDET